MDTLICPQVVNPIPEVAGYLLGQHIVKQELLESFWEQEMAMLDENVLEAGSGKHIAYSSIFGRITFGSHDSRF